MCESKDARDMRPLIYPGRVLVQNNAVTSASWMWKKSQLIQQGRTDLAQQQAPSEMEHMDETNSGALPLSCADNPVQGSPLAMLVLFCLL